MTSTTTPLRQILLEIFSRLQHHYGPTGWWPGDSPFEIAVGAILTQNTAWKNVEKAIANLKKHHMLRPAAILNCEDTTLHELLRPSGYFKIKTLRLKAFCQFLVDQYHGKMENLAKQPISKIRSELLKVSGIGPETADDIILYACEKPIFVIDAYTRRIFARHKLCEPDISYHEFQELFHRNLPHDVELFKEYHALLVYIGKEFCRKQPRCTECPLAPLLPSDSATIPKKTYSTRPHTVTDSHATA